MDSLLSEVNIKPGWNCLRGQFAMKTSGLNKNIPTLLLYLVITSYVTQICSAQKEHVSRWDIDGDYDALKNYETVKNLDGDIPSERILCSSNSVEDCEDDRENIIYNMQLWKRQPLHAASAFVASKGDKTIRTGQAGRCTCELEHSIVDLGLSYYPRYIPSLVCNPGGCQNGHQCHAKKYKVWVLKRKQAEDVDPPESNPGGIPKILKDLYLSKTISATVACECAP